MSRNNPTSLLLGATLTFGAACASSSPSRPAMDAEAAGHWRTATEAYRELLEESPQQAEYWLGLARSLKYSGHIADSIEKLEEAIERLGPTPEFSYALAESLAESGQPERAEKTLTDHLQRNATDPKAKWMLGELYYDQDRVFEAETQYESTLQLESANPLALARLAKINEIHNGDRLAAESCHRRIVRSAEENGRERAAAVGWLETNRLDPQEEMAQADYLEGRIAYDRGSFDEAAEAFLRGLQSGGDAGSHHYYLGLTYLRMDQYAEALDAFGKSKAQRPNDGRIDYQIGWVHKIMSRPFRALEAWKKALSKLGRDQRLALMIEELQTELDG